MISLLTLSLMFFCFGSPELNAGKSPLLEFLYEKAITKQTYKHFPLHYAAKIDDIKEILFYVNDGYDVNQVNPLTGTTPLHEAVQNGCMNATYNLLALGTEISTVSFGDNCGKTPVHLAIENKSMIILALLMMICVDEDSNEQTQVDHFSLASSKGFILEEGIRIGEELISKRLTDSDPIKLKEWVDEVKKIRHEAKKRF